MCMYMYMYFLTSAIDSRACKTSRFEGVVHDCTGFESLYSTHSGLPSQNATHAGASSRSTSAGTEFGDTPLPD